MIKKRLISFIYAFQGIIILTKSDLNFKIHMVAMVGVLIAGFLFRIAPVEWGLVFLAIGLVLAAEGLNSALEYVVDLVSPDYNELAGKAKDVAAGAVLIAAFFAACVGVVVFLPKFL